ncbi:MAG: U32 family peptidase [Bacteroidales bacterium]|nr:U32 family peptidase [Bacteroidales bacterium]
MTKPRELELLAPARDAATAIAAIDHGADAVYIGAAHHGARSAAGNSLEDIKRVAEYAHRFRAKVYVTLNTLVYDDEITEVEYLVGELYRAGIDALIVQDLSLLRMSIPPIALHASTQCDIRTPEKARFLQSAGFKQLVLARELTLDEIRAIRRATTVPLEAFVHGALCVSYSGNCQASFALTGRSANRGECAQICRYAYDLIDGDGRRIVTGKHLLSLKDMNRIASLSSMIDAGVSSFKIEGRLKDIAYVKTVTAAYRQALDRIITASDGRLRRSSFGESEYTFVPKLEASFNRGYTDYFLKHRRPNEKIASVESPKSIGQEIGTVSRVDGRKLTLRTDKSLSNGDGLTFYGPDGRLSGFRVNRVEGSIVYLNNPVDIRPGTRLYRNFDSAYELRMSKPTAQRRISVYMTLRSVGDKRIALDIIPVALPSLTASAVIDCDLAPAEQPQAARHESALSKLGDSAYRVAAIHDEIPDKFIPASVVTQLRRDAVAALDRAIRATHPFEYSSPVAAKPELWTDTLTYSDNIANRLSAEYVREAGANSVAPALEVAGKISRPLRVMKTRYCLRRELGHCLRTPEGAALKGPLSLRSGNNCLDLDFDCNACEMSVYLGGNRLGYRDAAPTSRNKFDFLPKRS